jgi:hypothetical protein
VAHPVWASGTSVYQGIAEAGDRWLVVHLLLTVGFPTLAFALYRLIPNDESREGRVAAWLLGLFGAAAAAFLALDGVVTGMMVRSAAGQEAAQQVQAAESVRALWASPLALGLANLTGLTFALALSATALALYPRTRGRLVLACLGIVVAALVGAALASMLGFLWPPALARVAGIATGAVAVYRQGATAIPFALLVLAGVLPQHVGLEAQVGLLCVFFAIAGRAFVWPPGPRA